MSLTGFFKKKVKTTIDDEEIASLQALKKKEPKYVDHIEAARKSLLSAQEAVFSKNIGPEDIEEVTKRLEALKIAIETRNDTMVKHSSEELITYIGSLTSRAKR